MNQYALNKNDKESEPRISTLPKRKSNWRVNAAIAAFATGLFVFRLFSNPDGVLLHCTEFVIATMVVWFFDGLYKRWLLPRQTADGKPDPLNRTRKIVRYILTAVLFILALVILIQTWNEPGI